jgi:hypothetical protein
MIHAVARLIADPRFRLALILLLMAGIALGCDDHDWQRVPWPPE